MRAFISFRALALTAATLLPVPALSQGTPGAPPAVGVVKAEFKPMAESTEINGRIEARNRVDLIARVTAFLNERLFTEGADVKTGAASVSSGTGAVRSRRRGQGGCGCPGQGPTGECRSHAVARAGTVAEKFRNPGRSRQRAGNAARCGGAGEGGGSAASSVANQSRLHRDKIANRWPHRSNGDYDRKCRRSHQRHAGDGCQSGSDVRDVSGIGAPRYRVAGPLCR